MTMTNDTRALRAQVALNAYQGTDGEAPKIYDLVCDLVCDLMHLAERRDIDAHQMLQQASSQHREELFEERLEIRQREERHARAYG